MLDPQNLVTISGGLVSDPEIINGKIFKTSLAVDYAGSDKNTENTSGYFDVVFYLKDASGTFAGKNASFVATQVEAGKMKKGTSVSIVGRLVQERWKQDDKNRSRVVIVAEHLTYGQRAAGSKTATTTDSTGTAPAAAAPSSIPSSF